MQERIVQTFNKNLLTKYDHGAIINTYKTVDAEIKLVMLLQRVRAS